MRIRQKLVLSFGFVILLIVVITALLFWSTQQLGLEPERPGYAFISSLALSIVALAIASVVLFIIVPITRSVSIPSTKLKGTPVETETDELDIQTEIKSNNEVAEPGSHFAMSRKTGSPTASEETVDDLKRPVQNNMELAAHAPAEINSEQAAKLEELYKDLKKAKQELEDFAYIVSHDLKAPLRGIKTLTNWISTDYADKLDEAGREQINLLSSQVCRMNNMIDGILEYSRVGRIEEEKVQINLNELVSEVIDIVAPPENIVITIENELPVVKHEKNHITQLFQHLLSNAVRYMDKPQGQIRVGCVEEGKFWKFSVADNGPGIEEKNFEKAFTIFQILSPRDEDESTGIGLTIAKKIVETYGGTIWLESELGQGTTFFFTLPKQEKETTDADARI